MKRLGLWISAALVLAHPAASACSLIEYADDGAYVGGGLVQQVVRKAHTIQIVKATSRHIVQRSFTAGNWFLRTGDHDVPKNEPEYVDQFVYELSVVETLKGHATPPKQLYYENKPRILAYGAREMLGPPPKAARRPNALPDSLLERPGLGHTAYIGASPGGELGLGSCASPYLIDVGDVFLAFRDGEGRLYPTDTAFPLAIDAEFGLKSKKRQKVQLAMQSLVPVQDGSRFLSAIRAEIAAKH